MRNRAKCRLCNDIIESIHSGDYVSCKCGEISIDGGNMHYKVAAKDFKNFLRIDDEGKEVEVTVEDETATVIEPVTKEDLIQMLDEMCKRFESLPVDALYAPVTHADFSSLLILLTAILRAEK